MRASRTRQHGVARSDLEFFSVNRHHAAAAEDVINLVLALQVIADRRSRLERALPEYETEVRRLPEERIAHRLAAAVVRARLIFRNVLISLEHIAAGRL